MSQEKWLNIKKTNAEHPAPHLSTLFSTKFIRELCICFLFFNLPGIPQDELRARVVKNKQTNKKIPSLWWLPEMTNQNFNVLMIWMRWSVQWEWRHWQQKPNSFVGICSLFTRFLLIRFCSAPESIRTWIGKSSVLIQSITGYIHTYIHFFHESYSPASPALLVSSLCLSKCGMKWSCDLSYRNKYMYSSWCGTVIPWDRVMSIPPAFVLVRRKYLNVTDKYFWIWGIHGSCSPLPKSIHIICCWFEWQGWPNCPVSWEHLWWANQSFICLFRVLMNASFNAFSPHLDSSAIMRKWIAKSETVVFFLPWHRVTIFALLSLVAGDDQNL